jgi:preprotein translocase subunit SecD
MGAGAPEEQARNAKQLELVLRSGALPAPLTLLSEDAIAPALSPGAFRALVTGASLVLAFEVALALWLAFRKDRARPSPAGTGVASP